MKRAVLVGEKTLEVQSASLPTIKDDEVLLEIKVCGICGSDLHIYGGNHPVLKPPVMMGHEFSGRIIEKGAKVTRFNIGEAVAAIPGVGCGTCEPCKNGDLNLCVQLKVIGGHYPGAFANYTVVPERNLVTIPEKFTATEGAMVESAAVAVHAVRRLKAVEGKQFCVLGAGPIGLFIVQVLKAFGAGLVIASDPVESRRNIAKQLGADIVVDPIKENIEQVVNNVSAIGLDGAFDVAGQEITFHQALNITRRGGEIVVVALFGEDPQFPIKLLQRGEKSLLGTQMYVKDDFEEAIRLIQAGKVKVNEMITHRFPLSKISEAFQLAASRSPEVGKIVIDIE